jgi:hypothetical protein
MLVISEKEPQIITTRLCEWLSALANKKKLDEEVSITVYMCNSGACVVAGVHKSLIANLQHPIKVEV